MLSSDESYLLESEDQNEIVDIDQEAEIPTIFEKETPIGISIHAFEGQMNPSTIKLMEGFILCQSIIILVDLGSTHNFMQLQVAIALKMIIPIIKPFKVAIGNGENLIFNKVCKNVEIKIQRVSVVMDIFLISVFGSNVLIGVQWSRSLVKMKFKWNGKEVTWQGIYCVSDDPLTTRELKSLCSMTSQAYFRYYEAPIEIIDSEKLLEEHLEIHEVVRSFGDIFF